MVYVFPLPVCSIHKLKKKITIINCSNPSLKKHTEKKMKSHLSISKNRTVKSSKTVFNKRGSNKLKDLIL